MRFNLFLLGFLLSCSNLQEERSLSTRIHAEVARSLQEIKSQAELLLSEHPELTSEAKAELRSILARAIETQQLLKDEESKIIQLLLKHSLRVHQLTETELEEKSKLHLRLRMVYKEKSRNVEDLIVKIVTLTEENKISESFRHDFVDFMGGFR